VVSSVATAAPDAVGNAPREQDPFVGREQELDRLRAMQAETRLLTLIGPDGVGKSRLVRRLKADVHDGFPDGSWLVDLSSLTDPALVVQAVGDVLGVRQTPGQSWVDALTRALEPRRLLLVLDNCDRLRVRCADLAEHLLKTCPALHLLATCSEPLDAADETTWLVPPLEVPPSSASDIRELRASEAVRLFVARVNVDLPDFALSECNADVVAEICRRLGGLPLALKLAAVWIKQVGLAEVAAHLRDSFPRSIGATRTWPSQQGTLRAGLEWSHSLLEEDERVLIRRLAVFADGWTLGAAEEVCSGDGLAEDAVADVLGRLVSKSLVTEYGDPGVRYRLRESVRAYALGHLASAGEVGVLRARHAAWLLRLAERLPPESTDPTQAGMLLPEQDNIRAALEWALQEDQASVGLRLVTAASALWWFTGHHAEGRAWFSRLLALPGATAAPVARSYALTFSAAFGLLLGDNAGAQEQGQAALRDHESREDARGIALTLHILGNVALNCGELEQAGALHADAARWLRALGSPAHALSLSQSGSAAYEVGDAERLRELIAEMQSTGQVREPHLQAAELKLRGLLAAAEGHLSTAASLLEQSLTLAPKSRYRQTGIAVMTRLGHLRLDQGQPAAAVVVFADALQLARGAGESVRLIRVVEGCARCLAASDADAAVRLAGAAAGERRAFGAVLWPSEQRYLNDWLQRARHVLGPSAYQRAWDDGCASTLAQAVSLAEVLLAGSPAVASPNADLSAREREVARLLARGLTNKQIATALVVSPGTVRTHVEHILTKLGLRSRAQIAVWASQQGLLPASSPG
jgi:predicted ATPase/DNA-binding CsgD family transcriptional regulator